MEARITERQDTAATLEVTVPADVVDATFERVLGALARQVRVPGFRPGKAPRGVLIQKVGAEALAEEVREAIVDEHYPQAVRELGLTPIHAHTHAEPPVAGADFTFVVHADLYPEFTLPDVDAITIDTAGEPIGDADVEATVARLREDHATLVPVERPIEAGDVVFTESQGEGGGQVMPIDLERTEEHLVAQLLGKSAGDELALDLGEDPAARAQEAAAPADSDADAQASGDEEDAAPGEGDATPAPRRSLSVKIADVKAKERPDADDAFAATLGFGDWAEVEAEIRRGLGVERERETFRAQRDELVEKLMGGTEVPLPGTLVRRRQGHLLEDLAGDLKRRGLTMEKYVERLEQRGERENFENELREAAERGVKRDLVLERLVEVHGTAVDDVELDAAIRHAALRERKDPERFKRDQGPEWVENFRFLLARDKTLDQIVSEKVGAPTATAPETTADDATDASPAAGEATDG
ncbi:MAG: trigger factor [Trueperaceae bacterium]|nr:trigger factor [Trueperaceae bacterium]